MATAATHNRVIQIHCDEELYENFQRLRRQSEEPSDSSLGRKLLQRCIVEDLDGAGTQRHFQATYQHDIRMIRWLLLAIFSAHGATLAAITKLAGKPQPSREVIKTLAASYAQAHGQFKNEIQHLIDTTEDH